MPRDAQNVHGLSSDFLTGQPVFEMVVDDFLAFIGDAPLVAHNAAFDMEFLNWELKRAGLPLLPPDARLPARPLPGAPGRGRSFW